MKKNSKNIDVSMFYMNADGAGSSTPGAESSTPAYRLSSCLYGISLKFPFITLENFKY